MPNFVQVESLQALIKDKMEDYSVLLSAKEQCQRDVEERNEEIEKLTTRIRELEQALLSCAEASRTVTQLEQELQKARKSLQELTQVQRKYTYKSECVFRHFKTHAFLTASVVR